MSDTSGGNIDGHDHPSSLVSVTNAGLTRNCLENWVYGPARPADLDSFWVVKCLSDQYQAGQLG